jgi:transposase
MIRFDDLPSDPLLLKQKLIETTSIIEKVSAEKVALADERNVAIAQRDAALQENEKLLLILSQYKRALFGRRSEKMDADQLQLLLSGNEASIVAGAANENAAADGAGDDTKAGAPDKPARPRPNRNRGMLPVHLPRVDVVIDVESKICPCCGGSLHKIGETVKEMLDVVPVQYQVKRMVRPRYGCRGCESAVMQAPAPAQPIDGGMATEAVLAHVATMKYGYQVPLYRQEQMLASQGIDLDRATLALWMGRLAWWLRPLHDVLLDTVLSYPKLFADETPLPVLDPGRGKTKTCRLWVAAMDDRPWGGPAPPAVVYVFAEDRKGERATDLFAGFNGILQVDGYAGYNGLLDPARPGGPVTFAFCFAHSRRKFYDVHVATGSPIAAEAVRRIGEFYAIEDRIRGKSADIRCAVRQAETKPLMEDFKLWLEARLGEVSQKSGLAEAIRYALSHWEGLTRFLSDGRIEIDSNTVERTMRPIGLGRRNYLFAGSDEGGRTWAIIASLINSAKLIGIDPQEYLTDVLKRIVSGRTKINQLEELLPWCWKAARQVTIVKAVA